MPQDSSGEMLNRFARKPLRLESRLLVHSVCNHCGDSKIGSFHDGSMQEWEASHKCKAHSQTSDDDAA
jgi:hypothetical protein